MSEHTNVLEMDTAAGADGVATAIADDSVETRGGEPATVAGAVNDGVSSSVQDDVDGTSRVEATEASSLPDKPSSDVAVPGAMPFHAIADLFPLLEGQEFDELKADIKAHGQREPIWVANGAIIDGRNRYRACRNLNITPVCREWPGSGDLRAFVLSANLHRRHLNQSQRAIIAARLKTMFEEEAGLRMRAGRAADPGANLPKGRARDKAAKALNVSPRSVEAGGKVLECGSPDLVQAVQAGSVSVSAAADLATLPPDDQAETLAKGEKAVKSKAKTVRAQKSQDRAQRKSTSAPAEAHEPKEIQNTAVGVNEPADADSGVQTTAEPIEDPAVLLQNCDVMEQGERQPQPAPVVTEPDEPQPEPEPVVTEPDEPQPEPAPAPAVTIQVELAPQALATALMEHLGHDHAMELIDQVREIIQDQIQCAATECAKAA